MTYYKTLHIETDGEERDVKFSFGAERGDASVNTHDNVFDVEWENCSAGIEREIRSDMDYIKVCLLEKLLEEEI